MSIPVVVKKTDTLRLSSH